MIIDFTFTTISIVKIRPIIHLNPELFSDLKDFRKNLDKIFDERGREISQDLKKNIAHKS